MEHTDILLDSPQTLAPDARILLLVDDEQNILTALKRLLRGDGYHILTATGADEGLALLSRYAAGVVMSDQRMPQKCGVEFLTEVKMMRPHAVRIMLSGYTELKSVVDAVNRAGIHKFLMKPWDDEQVRATILEAFQYHERLTADCPDQLHPAPSSAQMAFPFYGSAHAA